MKSKSVDEVISKIDELHKLHLSSRGIIQYVREDRLGKSEINWGAKTNDGWFDISFKFRDPITKQTIAELNRLSEFMNQNFIVRLHSLLEYEGIKSSKARIDTTIDGHEMIQVIHFLRVQFAHRHGRFDPNDSDSVTLRNRLFDEFDVSPEDSLPNQFPLDKNRVILPIVKGTKDYVRGFWRKYRNEKDHS